MLYTSTLCHGCHSDGNMQWKSSGGWMDRMLGAPRRVQESLMVTRAEVWWPRSIHQWDARKKSLHHVSALIAHEYSACVWPTHFLWHRPQLSDVGDCVLIAVLIVSLHSGETQHPGNYTLPIVLRFIPTRRYPAALSSCEGAAVRVNTAFGLHLPYPIMHSAGASSQIW